MQFSRGSSEKNDVSYTETRNTGPLGHIHTSVISCLS